MGNRPEALKDESAPPMIENVERGLYIAASGMLTELQRQDQIANDLANASTPGYKSDRTTQQSFGDMLLANEKSGQTVGSLGMGECTMGPTAAAIGNLPGSSSSLCSTIYR